MGDQSNQNGRGEEREQVRKSESDQQKENDRLYVERMEDEYAKREGGA